MPHAHHGNHHRRHVHHATARTLHPDLVVAPMYGTIVAVSVEEGDEIAAGKIVVILEAMKMEQPLRAGVDGRVTGLSVKLGDQVKPGAVICRLEPAVIEE